jgi:hypothetical protein
LTGKPTKGLQINSAIRSQSQATKPIGVVSLGRKCANITPGTVVVVDDEVAENPRALKDIR